MKVQLEIDEKVVEEKVTIEARAMSQEVTDLVNYIKRGSQQVQTLTARKGEEVHLINLADIYQLVIVDKVLYLKTATDELSTTLRLYQAKEILPVNFLQISQSEIINLTYLDHLSLTGNGLVKIVMKNGNYTYSSRRYLKSIKEVLGL